MEDAMSSQSRDPVGVMEEVAPTAEPEDAPGRDGASRSDGAAPGGAGSAGAEDAATAPAGAEGADGTADDDAGTSPGEGAAGGEDPTGEAEDGAGSAAGEDGALPARPGDRGGQRLAVPGTDRLRVVELSEEERELAAEAVERGFLERAESGGVELETPGFFDAAEILEGALPEQARAGLAALRRGGLDALVLRGLPSDPEPGPTPLDGDGPASPPRRGHAWIAAAVRRLGHEFGYTLEKKGSVVHDIHPTREGARTQSNASFEVDLSLHTENAFHPIRPDYVMLYCVRTQPEAPATRLVLLDDVLSHLTDAEIEVLRERRFTIRVVDSHKVEGEDDAELPVTPITGSPRRPIIRWHETLRATDGAAARVCRAFGEAATRSTRHVRLEQGDMLAFANEYCLHGRDRFDARLDGSDRWLLRGFALRDSTRIAPFVAPARPRVTRVDLTTHPGA